MKNFFVIWVWTLSIAGWASACAGETDPEPVHVAEADAGSIEHLDKCKVAAANAVVLGDGCH